MAPAEPAAPLPPAPLASPSAAAGPEIVKEDSEPAKRASMVGEDVEPSITVFESKDVEVRIGGLVQVHVAPWVGPDSLVSNADIATREGFRLRRARLGAEGYFGSDLRLLIVVNPLESDPDVGSVSDASISYQATPWLRLRLGTDKVPFSRAELESSSDLAMIERPLAARTMVPDRRLGLTAEGKVMDQRLAYLVAFMNGTEGYDAGNRFGGFLFAGRLQGVILKQAEGASGSGIGVAAGIGALAEYGPATHTVAGSVDVGVAVHRALAKIEFLCDRTTPQDAPVTSPGVADTIDRCGAYVELSYTLPRWSLQPVVRAELFDDDRAVEDAGDAMLVSAGVNVSFHRHSRVQLHYLHRNERFGNERQNDAVILNVQGKF